ncbi:hypothetical protein BDQ17DRAFT_1538106 [Cyathus striatus]|nr:hypothetical protein BDQ17DRAFT_1538106 [Cyathus striatus]
MFKPRIVCLLLPFIAAAIAAEDKPCTIHAEGKFFDLTPLKTSKDQSLKTFGGREISLNICQTAKTETFGLKDDIKQEDVAAFVHGDHGSFVLGKVNSTLDVFNSNPRLHISHGSKCKSDSGEITNTRASALINFKCDTSVIGLGKPRLEAQLPSTDDDSACAFVFEWKTPYACPAREGGFLWNLFVFIIVSILCLLMAYTVLGTLYNRYVLQLRGFDQIPQFSLDSMRYHAAEAWDWTRDMLATMNINLPQRRPTFGSSQTNPISHQSQAGGFRLGGDEEDYESGLGQGGRGGGGGGFVRPQHRFRPAPKPSTNPVSHQSQVNSEALRARAAAAAATPSTSPPAPPPKEPTPEPQPQSSAAGRAFALGDDEEGEELVDVKPKPSAGDSPRSSTSSSSSSETIENNSGGNNAAALRGRDLGNDGVIRL